MKVQNVKKRYLFLAVSLACSTPLVANAAEDEEQLKAIKLSTYQQQLLVNTVYLEQGYSFVDAQLLTKVESLPPECDVQSVYPVAEQFVANPDASLVGQWVVDEPFMDDDELDEDETLDDGESEEDADDQEDGENEENLEDESDIEDEDADEAEDELEDDKQDINLQAYLSVTASGYLVSSEIETEQGVNRCEVVLIGELNGDTFTAAK